MITKQELIDAVGGLISDIHGGSWGLNDDEMHPALAKLLERLPDAPTPNGWRKGDPLVMASGSVLGLALADAFELNDGEWWVPYRAPVGLALAPVTGLIDPHRLPAELAGAMRDV